jgi:hypothetical protein
MMREEGRQEETIIHRRNGYVESKKQQLPLVHRAERP